MKSVTSLALAVAISIAVAAQDHPASSPLDPSFAGSKKGGAILEPLFAKMPDHPGLAHYIIHSYDYPPLADEALEAARRYAKIAPDSPPHAVAYVHGRRLLAGIDRREHRVGGVGAARRRWRTKPKSRP
jgi:uncharacterized protein Usg